MPVFEFPAFDLACTVFLLAGFGDTFELFMRAGLLSGDLALAGDLVPFFILCALDETAPAADAEEAGPASRF